MAKEQGWDIEAVLNNDIVGGDKSAEQDHSVVRVFSEGVPAAATEQEMRRIRGLGGESDSASRELARYIAEVGRDLRCWVKPMLVFRLDRYLRGGDHFRSTRRDFRRCGLRSIAKTFTHQHQNVRTENGIEYGDRPSLWTSITWRVWRG